MGLFSFFYSSDSSADSKEVVSQQAASEDTIVPYDRFDFREVTALMLDALFKDYLYDDTMKMLNSIPNLQPTQVAILSNVDQQGVLVDGVRRGWHKKWIAFGGTDKCFDDDIDYFHFNGWCYVQYDESGNALEPYLHYPDEVSPRQLLKYYPSRNTWMFFELDNDDDGEEDAQLYSVVVTHTTAEATDYVQFDTDFEGNVLSMFERYRGQPRLDVAFSDDGTVRRVTTFSQDVNGIDEQLYRVYNHAAPTLDEIIDFSNQEKNK